MNSTNIKVKVSKNYQYFNHLGDKKAVIQFPPNCGLDEEVGISIFGKPLLHSGIFKYSLNQMQTYNTKLTKKQALKLIPELPFKV